MKGHLFYTFLVIFAATAVVTLLGVSGYLTIAEGYLTPLMTAFLVELAAAVVAIFRKASFFEDEGKASREELERVTRKHSEALEQLKNCASTENLLREDIKGLQKDKQKLEQRLEKLDSTRLGIMAILGSTSQDRLGLLRELHLQSDSPEGRLAMSVVGKLVDEGKIEQDPMQPSGYYRLKRS